MSNDDRAILIQAARSSLVTFVYLAMTTLIGEYRHFSYVDLISAFLEDIVSPQKPKRLVVNLPPRHGKSYLLIAAAAWYIGRYPEREIMLVAHSQSLSNDLAAKLGFLMDSKLYKQVFPDFQFLPGREKVSDFRTTKNGGFLAGSIDTGLTGRGADLLLIDDSISVHDANSAQRRAFVCDTYDGMLSTRLNDLKTGAVIAMSHRVHSDDLSGHLINNRGFAHLRLPFRAEEDEEIECNNVLFKRKKGELLQAGRISDEDAQKLETMPPHKFATQYQQTPVAAGSGILQLQHFPLVDTLPSAGTNVISWDIASSLSSTASYSVGLVFQVHQDVAYLRHIMRERLEYPNLIRCVIDLHERFRPQKHLVEIASLGKPVAAELKAAGGNVEEIATGAANKVERLEAVFHRVHAGYVQILKSMPNLSAFLDECLTFPHGNNDDQVDALTQFLNWQLSGANAMNQEKVFRRIQPRNKYTPILKMIGKR